MPFENNSLTHGALGTRSVRSNNRPQVLWIIEQHCWSWPFKFSLCIGRSEDFCCWAFSFVSSFESMALVCRHSLRRQSLPNSWPRFDSNAPTCFRLMWSRLPEHTSRSWQWEPVLLNVEVRRDGSDRLSLSFSKASASSDLMSLRRVDSASSVHLVSSPRSTLYVQAAVMLPAELESLVRKVSASTAIVLSASVWACLRKPSDLDRMLIFWLKL